MDLPIVRYIITLDLGSKFYYRATQNIRHGAGQLRNVAWQSFLLLTLAGKRYKLAVGSAFVDGDTERTRTMVRRLFIFIAIPSNSLGMIWYGEDNPVGSFGIDIDHDVLHADGDGKGLNEDEGEACHPFLSFFMTCSDQNSTNQHSIYKRCRRYRWPSPHWPRSTAVRRRGRYCRNGNMCRAPRNRLPITSLVMAWIHSPSLYSSSLCDFFHFMTLSDASLSHYSLSIRAKIKDLYNLSGGIAGLKPPYG